ncbi:non-homologous end-joining DNA ligase [uncultured Thiohalocapsa sp.]|uniref:non-homologous end-joining DNA ligase n=1 Tax=uncultured Thiohalocapsa sp. TaxID=768990 RepID=UPI0025E246ED|nr:non-homologous end-joining DNA ligase [uncultured Thiohalocapsa sp.]
MDPIFDFLDTAERADLTALDPDAPRPVDPSRTGPHGPMLATLTHDVVTGPEWVYERKLDGERCIAICRGGDVRLSSRSGQRLNGTYPELVEALAAQACDDFVVDGEVVAFDGPRTSFRKLQQRMQRRDADDVDVAVFLYLFDIPCLLGQDCRRLPQRTRKELLRRALDFADPLRFTSHRNAEGEHLLREACEAGWEGLIAKRADAPYHIGRSEDWLKLKCEHRQELVIGGFTEPRGSRPGFGALIIGYYEDGALVCAGKVGTGFDTQTLHELREELERHTRDDPPFDRGELPDAGVHWVDPELVGEVAFTEWTRDGRLRHPRFLGLRRDKPATAVVREDDRATG